MNEAQATMEEAGSHVLVDEKQADDDAENIAGCAQKKSRYGREANAAAAGEDARGRGRAVEGDSPKCVQCVVLRSYAGSRFVWEICMGGREEVGERAGSLFTMGE